MAPQQPSRRFGSVAQRDRGRGYERRAQAGFQQTPRFEYRKNLVGPAQMAPGQFDISGPIRSAMEAHKEQRRADNAGNSQRRYSGYGASTRPGGAAYSSRSYVGKIRSPGRFGGVRVTANRAPQFSGVRSIGGVVAPGANTTFKNGVITTQFGQYQ
jgi:hypothetical protein